MKFFRSIIVILACFSPWLSSASTNTAASASDTDIRAAINASARNDTVLVPAGTVTWSAPVIITKGIKLIGAGRASTIVTYSGTDGLQITPDSTATGNQEQIGVWQFSLSANRVGLNNIKITAVDATSGDTTPWTNLVIGNNMFRDTDQTTTSAAGSIMTFGQIRGVIYSNIFQDVCVLYKINGSSGNGGDPYRWNNGLFPRLPYFTKDQLFFEGNTIQFTASWAGGGGNTAWMTTIQDGRAVIRYNTFNYTNALPGGILDQHGFQYNPNGDMGTKCQEFYGNTFLCPNNPYEWWSVRGVGALYFNNKIVTAGGSPSMHVREYQGSCPADVPLVTGDTTTITNAYFFNNNVNGSDQNTVTDAGYTFCGLAENVHFWNYNGSFNATVGIGRGTAAPAGTYPNPSAGVAYWQATTATTTTDPAIIQNGTLWIAWNGGTWTSLGHPFAFPHPLSVPSDPSIVTQPQNTTACANNTATFTVTASGQSALSYQWNWHATNVTGATASSWTTPTLVSADGVSSVFVTVTDTAGSVQSSTVTLTVTPDPTITAQPQNQTTSVGLSATFSVTASSCNASTLSYQWKFNGGNVGSNSSSYTRNNCVLADNGGSVTVVVTDTAGSLTSSTATLTVTTSATPQTMTIGQGSGAASGTVTIGQGSGAATGTITISK